MGTPLSLGDRRRWRYPGLIVVLLLVAVVFTIVAPATAEYWGFGGLLAGLGGASVLLMRRSSDLMPRERRVWRLIAFSMGIFFVGVLAVGILSEAGFTVRAYGPLDTFFVAAYLVMIFALYRMARLESAGREWVLTLSDAMVGAVALSALVWGYLYEPLTILLSNAPAWEVVMASAYPILDVMLIVALLIMILRRSHYHMDIRLGFFAAGMVAQVFGDFIYMSGAIGQEFTSSEPAWPMNLMAAVCLVLTGTFVDRVPKRREFAEGPTPMWALIWPYLLAALLLIVHLENYRSLDPDPSKVVLLDAVIAIGVILFVRQVYVIYRDRHHVDRKRAELVASVSHELRTPLTAMVGYLTLLDQQSSEFSGEVREEMIAEATNQARHMSRLVSDLLMLARGDTSYMTLEKSEVAATSIVTSVLRDTDVGDTCIEEELDVAATVEVDLDRLKQALGNLLSNAARYGAGRCLIIAKTKGDDLVMEVHDDGDGIPPKYQSAIWAQFERGAHRLDAATPGLGIGLSIVQAVVESHGGHAHYRDSERLGGACFSLNIPGSVVRSDARSKLPAFPL